MPATARELRVDPRDGRGAPLRDWTPRLRVGDRTQPSDITVVWEGAVAIRRNVFEAAGGWPSAFRFVHEGVDLAQGGDDGASLECLLIGEGCATDSEQSLDGVISSLKKAPHNDAVTAQLVLEPDEESQGDSDEGSAAPVVSATKLQKLTVTGQRSIEIAVR